MRKAQILGLLAALAIAPAATGCEVIWGLTNPILTGDAGGSGGSGGGDACSPGDIIECPYSGPAGTKDTGTCKAGSKECLADGTGYGPCTEEVTPQQEDCTTAADENCDGQVNEATSGCLCTPNAMTACYTGPQGTAGVGICKSGTGVCNATGTGFGSCEGEVKPAAETCVNPSDENCDSYDCIERATLYGDADAQYGNAVAVDRSDNSYYVAGRFQGTMVVQGTTLSETGQGEAYLLKFDATGELDWAIQIGDAAFQSATAVATDGKGHVVVGGENGGTINIGADTVTPGFFVAEFAADGLPVWARSIGGAYGSGLTSVAFTPEGDVLCAGYFLGSLDVGDGEVSANAGLLADGTDGFVGKLRGTDGSGKVADGGWLKTFGDDALQAARSVRADSMGNVLLGGDFQGVVSFGGVTLTSKGGRDVFLTKLDPKGAFIWQLQFGDGKDQRASSLALDSLGGPVIAGSFEGTMDFGGTIESAPMGSPRLFIAKFTSSNFVEWSETVAAGVTVAVAFDPTDNVLVTGGFTGAIDLGGPILSAQGTDIFLAKLGSPDALVWNKRYGDDATQTATAVDTSSTGQSIVVGSVQGTTDFGTGPLTAKGTDMFVAVFGP